MGKYLSYLTWPKVKNYLQGNDLVLIPTGSCEQHGHHLPLGTDYLIVEKIAEKIKERCEILVCPTLSYGHSSNHERFSGTVTITPRTYKAFVDDIVISLIRHGFRKFIFLNGHSGNTPLLQEVCNLLRDEKAFGCIINWWEVVGMLLPQYALTGHGDALESSAIIATYPDLVHMDQSQAYSPKKLTKKIKVESWQKIKFKSVSILTWLKSEDGSDTGNFGSLEGSSIKQGQEVIEIMIKYLADFILELRGLKIDKLQ